MFLFSSFFLSFYPVTRSTLLLKGAMSPPTNEIGIYFWAYCGSERKYSINLKSFNSVQSRCVQCQEATEKPRYKNSKKDFIAATAIDLSRVSLKSYISRPYPEFYSPLFFFFLFINSYSFRKQLPIEAGNLG